LFLLAWNRTSRTAKVIGVYPVTKLFGSPNKEATYTTLLMSTGPTFGTISSLFGLSHGIIDKSQYSALVAAVIASAVIPTVIANAFYLPHHLLPEAEPEDTPAGQPDSRTAGQPDSRTAGQPDIPVRQAARKVD
jgi:Kef-type K+ transport system membrane component KefB